MFGCIYQLWDWLEAPPLFTPANMEAKKLQHIQQQQQKKMPLAYQTNISDYRTATHSPVFQQQQQQQQHQHQQQQNYHMHHLATGYQQSPATTSNTSSGPLTPIDIQPQTNNKSLRKHPVSNTTSGSQHASPYHQQYSGEQIYQSQPERAYVTATSRLQATSQNTPSSSLQQQYQQLQQAKMKAQLQTQAEAAQQQQRTFALRQQINPPVPQGHYHMSQSSSLMSAATQQQQQSPVSHQRAPPSTLNLSSQFQPAAGPLKVSSKQKPSGQHQAQQQHYQQQEHSIYAQQQQQLQLQLQLQHQQLLQHQQQQQQRLKVELQTPGGSEHSPVYIQQNHPGHVMNQACQTQISAVKTTSCVPSGVASKTPSSEDSAGKSPAHAPLDRKKSAGSIQALKSPMTKRPTSSHVSISGWLYKQGSDGLKVWRKRWFVLAEYCLYYYKGPEEEKLLGSILLPSYRVSACLPEDKIYRKYAFKCEHQNMRTYWLAAESGESMVQWVRALSAATMMQAPSSGESDQNSQPSVGSSVNHSGENSDSGIHTLQSQQSKMSLNQGPVTPASDNVNVQSASSSNSGGGGGGGGAQPLYANAPPKPRRITDGGYSSPSPENSVDNEATKQQQLQLQHQQQATRHAAIMSPTLQQQQLQQYQQQQMRSQQHHAIYDTRTGNVTSTLRLQQQQTPHQVENLDSQFQQQLQLTVDDYNKSPPTSAQQYIDMEEQIMRLQQQRAAVPEDVYGERELHMQKLIQQRYAGLYPNAERRTPDAYGRSKNRVFSDYEDIYNLNQGPALMHEAVAASYRRPLSPPSYESNKHVPAMPSRYTPNHAESNSGAAPSVGSNSNIRSRSATASIVRPHSADFLEYDARSDAITAHTPAGTDVDAAVAAQSLKPDALRTQRPKSSLDINRTPDSIYYSEASYAEKMRKSALYLQNPQTQTQTQTGGGGGSGGGAQPQHPSSAYRPAANDIYGTGGVSGMNTIGYENPYERVYKRSELLGENQGAASMPRMSRSLGGAPQHAAIRSASTHPHHHQVATQQHEFEGGDVQQRQKQQYYQSSAAAASTQQQYLQQQNDQFLRSASARLPKRGAFDDEYVVGGMTTTSPAPKPGIASSALSHQEGERKREESMKRLLEWKQRMLQSPLTRKGIQQTVAGGPGSNMTAMSKLGSNPNILLASTAVASGAHRANRVGLSGGNTLVGGVSGIQRSRSETHANGGTGSLAAGYNSYSSDDEDPQIAPDGAREVKSPAGRSTATIAPTRQSNNKKAAATVSATTSSCSGKPSNSSSYTKATTIATVDTHCNKEPTQKNNDNDYNNDNDDDDDDDDKNTNNRNNNENICTHVNSMKTWPTTTLSTSPIKTATTTNPIKVQKLTPILLTKTKQIVVKPILKVLADEENLETPLKSAGNMTGTRKSAVLTDRSGVNYDRENNPVACSRMPDSFLGSRKDLQLNISDLKRQTETSLNTAPDNISKFSCSESVRGVAIKPKEPAPGSPQITNYVPVYTTKILTATESSRTIKDYENVVMQKETKEFPETIERSLSGMEEESSIETILDMETKEGTVQATRELLEEELTENKNDPKEVTVSPKPPTKSPINREETPMLMNLQAFKAAQEARQHIKETLVVSVEKSIESEGTDKEDVIVTTRESLVHDYDDDTDTACEEYTDDDLDEALAVEEEEEAQPKEQEEASISTPSIPQKQPFTIKATASESAETFQIYENKEAMAMTTEPQTPREHVHNESHYLPMTAKKIENTPNSPLSLVSCNDSNAEEENPYVEMTKTLHDDDSKSNYETVCVGKTSIVLHNKAKHLQVQMEPVYMELGQARQQHTAIMANPADANTIPELDRFLGRATLKKQSGKQKSDTLKKKAKKSSNERLQSKRKDLPDILKPSHSSLALSSDSSDADDESSKHIDGKKMRSRTRFSLSDTFRPASYYLGAAATLSNCAESSDSEIVSPPPIPSSPPPTEDLKTEEIFSSEIYDTVKRRDSSNSGGKYNLSYEQLPRVHTSNTSLNIAKQSSETALKSSRLSLPDQISKLRGPGSFKIPSPSLLNNHERTLSDSNYSFQTDNSSNTSSDFDLYNKLKQNSPSFIASPLPQQTTSSLSQKYPSIIAQTPSFIAGGGDSSETDSVEFRQRQGSDSELERQRSRRPLSEESISEIESMNERFEETLRSTDLDMYLNQLQTNDLYLYQNTTSLDAGVAGAGSLTNLIKPPEIFRNKDDDEHYYGNIHFVSSTDSLQRLGHEWKEERDRRRKEANLAAQSETDGASSATRPTPLHSRNNSNISEQSAPYYYSELMNASREVVTNTPPLTTLNNQRDVHAQSGSNIEHINNPIKQHAAINPATMDMLTEKDQAIDSKNLYKMKTNIEKLSYSSGKNLKSGDPFNQATTSAQSFHLQQLQCPQMKLKNYQTNLYQEHPQPTQAFISHPLNEPPVLTTQTESIKVAKQTNLQMRRHGKGDGGEALENVADFSEGIFGEDESIDRDPSECADLGKAVLGNRFPSTSSKLQLSNLSSSTASKLSVQSSIGSIGSGELLWEEDTLWRESLRRVSQRHARSLDDLDRIVKSPVMNVKLTDLAPQSKSRLSREVTYVNDNISPHLRDRAFRPRLSEPQTREEMTENTEYRRVLSTDTLMNEHDVYVQLSEMQHQPEAVNETSSDVYEVLREDSLCSGFSQKSNAGDMDRETLRQWDSMSSGLMKNATGLMAGGSEYKQESAAAANLSSVRSIIQQLNASCEPLDANGNPGASISVRNVRNLPKSNLTVKPDPGDPYPQQTLENYDHMNKLTSSYYGSVPDTKYAKTTNLTTDKIGGGDSAYFGSNGVMLASSTPVHAGNSHGVDYYCTSSGVNSGGLGGSSGGEVGVGATTGLNGSLYDVHQSGYRAQAYPIRRVGSRADIDLLERETSNQIRNLDVSAGDLLSRTHEELVLLLIQLRRQNSNTARAIEQCCTDIHEVQNRLLTADGLTRAESIQRLDYLKQHLLDLERQYEKSKPLVNLVDNMVKLGSLYRTNDVTGQRQTQQQQQILQQSQHHQRPEVFQLDRLEFNQRIQEQRMLQEEQKQWDRLSPDQTELQSKVQQLYYLDQLLQEESGTLQSLQRDKEDLERALGGIRARIQDTSGQPLALEAARKQQHMLERELSRVHQLLAENSKKLEQTVAGNSRLEQELLVLRQKLQASRTTRDSQGLFVSDTYTNNTTAMLESELKRVQTLVGDMQRQRQELSAAVRQLTENSTRLYQEIGNKQNSSSGGNSGSSSSGHIKKRSNSMCWIETDLDSMLSMDRTLSDSKLNLSTPLYVDTSAGVHATSASNLLNSVCSSKYSDYNTGGESLHTEPPDSSRRDRTQQYRYNDSSDNLETSGVDSDGFLETNPFAALSNQEKQEIKTVRIVKRESERRQRDRDRVGLSNSTQNLDQVLEEEQQLALLQSGSSAGVYPVVNGYGEPDYQTNGGDGGRSKSLPRQSYAETPKSRHHRHHHHQSSYSGQHGSRRYETNTTNQVSQQSKYPDYFANGADKNSNYSVASRHHGLTNGSITPKEHLNPLASAYFAKQHSSHARNSSQTALRQKTDSLLSLKSLTDLSPGPVFQSEAARQIINELSAGSASEDTEKIVEKVPAQHKHRRAVPREKRRHYTAPNNVNVKAMENIQAENDMNRNNTNWRARDDLDMEVALRPRINAPDVVRSALGHGEKISENTIDNLLLAPNKILIPERYIPEKTPELSPEEKKRRQEKVESIKKMLAETPISTANDTVSLPPSKINAEKKQREHLLQLNQILAQQVMQMSKIVAEKAMSKVNKMKTLPSNGTREGDDDGMDEEDRSESPAASLPIFQQRENFFT